MRTHWSRSNEVGSPDSLFTLEKMTCTPTSSIDGSIRTQSPITFSSVLCRTDSFHKACQFSSDRLLRNLKASVMSTLNPLPRLLCSNRLTTLAPSLSLPRSRSRSSYAYNIPPYAPKSTVPPSISNPEALTSTSSDLTPEQRKILDETIRVDQAGELGANYIYYGTTVALKMFGAAKGSSSTSSPSTFSSSPGDITASQVEEMWSTERHHLRTLNTLQAQHRVRPTLLWPVWKGMAFSLGAVTGMMGKESIMACTEAVETVIGEHYDE